ncbi:hypothetical protein tb265_46060 [Gemmatimonadetes bacterium T265]|nr:hypothetical protein tb265_46060 [Gemmatimonadetes bacterium T265]
MHRLLTPSGPRWIVAAVALAGAAAPCAAQPFAEPQFLFDYSASPTVTDYRPVVDRTGTRVVFERTTPGTRARLFIARLGDPAPAALLAPRLQLSTRPDWCWHSTGRFASGPLAFSNGRGVFVIDPDRPGSGRLLPGTRGMVYPAWFGGCAQLAVMQHLHSGPVTSVIDASTGTVIRLQVAGPDVWAGFPSVNPADNRRVAFAGSTVVPGAEYNQSVNYIWTADMGRTPADPAPLDSGAPRAFAPQFQGRAGWWSPDGRVIAFESNRSCGGGDTYAIFLQDGAGRTPAHQVTACGWNAQHAKWFPASADGRSTRLVVTVLRDPTGGRGRRGIASLDVTAFVTPGA